MSSHPDSQNTTLDRRVTLNSLKEDQFALNMRMIYAIQLHDEAEQAKIQGQLEAVQKEIRQLFLGAGR